jgi:hypothetical protein
VPVTIWMLMVVSMIVVGQIEVRILCVVAEDRAVCRT